MPQPLNAVTTLLQQALALHQKGKLTPAEELYKKTLAKAPEHFEANYLYGMLKLHKEDWAGAADQLAKAVSLNPAHVDTYFDLATALQHLARYDEAAKHLEQALRLKPDFTGAMIELGNCYRKSGRAEWASGNYRRALAIDPNQPEAWFQLGNAQHDLRQREAALESFRKALSLQPEFIEARFNLATTLKDLEQLDESLAAYDQIIQSEPTFAPALTNRGFVLALLNRPEEALASYDLAAELDGSSVELWFNRGATLETLQRFDEALASYQRAQEVDPNAVSPHWNESITRLLLGDFEEGWKKYEWRWKTEQMRGRERRFMQPLWLGDQPLDGKTILLHAEQGFGDTLQFARYAPVLAAQGAKVILEVQPALKSLMANLPGVQQVISDIDFPRPSFDLHCPLMSLPLACRTFSEADIPRAPYLIPSQAAWAQWYQRLPQGRALRVGLAWTGSNAATDISARRIDTQRSMSFDTLAPIVELAAEHKGLEFYSLQRDGDGPAQLRAHRLAPQVRDFTHQLRDFADTAALVAHLDLVITVDTAICHLAGALGKPVWLANRHHSDWRWQLGRVDSPWYANFTIFRQSNPDDWSDVIEQMRDALSQHLAVE